jgi:hypothetical protein
MTLPDHLSPEAAMALFDFVVDLERAIWDKYEHLLVPLCIRQIYPEEDDLLLVDQDPAPTDDFDDQLPLF